MAPQHLAIPELVYDPAKSVVGFNHQFTTALVTALKSLIEDPSEICGDFIKEGGLAHVVWVHLSEQLFKDAACSFRLDDARKLIKTTEQFLSVFQNKTKSEFGKLLERPVEELGLSTRADTCLKYAEIKTVSALVQKTEAEMLRMKNLGKHTLTELKAILLARDLVFGMKIEGGVLKWPHGREEQLFE